MIKTAFFNNRKKRFLHLEIIVQRRFYMKIGVLILYLFFYKKVSFRKKANK